MTQERAVKVAPRDGVRYVVACGHDGCGWSVGYTVAKGLALDKYADHERESHDG